MKKVWSIVLILLLVGVLAACSDAVEPEDTYQPEETLLPEESLPSDETERLELQDLPEYTPSQERPVPGVTAAHLQVQFLDQVDLEQFNDYHEFIESEEDDIPRIIITTEMPLHNFSFVELGLDENEWGSFEWATI